MRRFLLPALLCFAFVASLRAELIDGETLLAEMNCVACHQASDEVKARLASRAAPKLGENGAGVTAQWLEQFLTNPAATKPGTTMPDLLHNFSPEEKSKTVEALTHLLIGIQPPLPSTSDASEVQIATGQRLYHEIGCVQCHAPMILPVGKENDAAAQAELAKLKETSAPLGDLAKKYTVASLAAFLQDPLKSRPDGRMPAQRLTAEEATAVAIYLLREQAAAQSVMLPGLTYEYYEFPFEELPQFDRIKPTATGIAEKVSLDPAKRKNDFALRFSGFLNVPKDGDYRFWLSSDDGSQLFIDDKLVIDNGGVHLDLEKNTLLKLTAGLHPIMVTYFDAGYHVRMRLQWEGPGVNQDDIKPESFKHEGRPMQPSGQRDFVVDKAKMARGWELFSLLQCSQCHSLDHDPQKSGLRSEVVFKLGPIPPLDKLSANSTGGCLSKTPSAKAPHFALSDDQRKALQDTLQKQSDLATPLTAEEKIHRTMQALNCQACHARGEQSGPTGLRREYFVGTSDADLGDEGKIPPQLNGIGNKLQRPWLEEVLFTGASVRPYMATRMPNFGKANLEHLPEALEKADELKVRSEPATPADTVEHAKHGRKLLGTEGLSCIACHNFSGHRALGIPALDLATSSRRLRFDWFRRYLLDPISLRPGTRMPAFWPGGVAASKSILDGRAEEQIGALWLYLSQKDFVELPEGLIRGKLELVPLGEALIYRNFIDGGGSRAIGVGFPEKANFAFDANQVRMAEIWQGPFIDAARHRTGRGEGFEKPLGSNVVKLSSGASFAVLKNVGDSWPAEGKRTSGVQFRGYQLDEKQRPTFLYRVGEWQVTDSTVPMPGALDPALRRTITLKGAASEGTLYFRAAVGEVVEESGVFIVNKKLHLKFPGAQPVIRMSDGKSELLVPVIFKDGIAQLVEELVW